jgi:hypothetical protein
VFAAGAVGELFPIVAIALFLTQGNHFAALLSVTAVGLLAIALTSVPFIARNERLRAIIRDGQNATSQVMLRWSVVLLFLLLVIRGLPSLLIYRTVLPLRPRVEMTFITATAMPLLVALAEIGLRDGKMLPANAAAIVGAGVLSVLVFPAAATALARKGRAQAVPEEAAAVTAEQVPQARHPAGGLMPWHR